MYNVGDMLLLHSVDGNDYEIEIINKNEFRPPSEKYACDVSLKGQHYSDLYFCSDDFLNKCEVICN